MKYSLTHSQSLLTRLGGCYLQTIIKCKSCIIFVGGDDGFLHIWDLRQFTNKTPVGTFKHHTAPVTSVEWHWAEPSVLASSGEDNQVALWDLAVERDDDEVVDEELKVSVVHFTTYND